MTSDPTVVPMPLSTSKNSAYDVCIFGAGPAGIAVAIRLAALGCVSALVLDRPLPKKPWGGESFSGAIGTPLRALGCWEQFENAGHRRGYDRQSAWGSEPRVENSIFRVDGPFWHVDRERFDDDLRSAALARGIPFLSYRRLDSVTRESDTGTNEIDIEFGAGQRQIMRTMSSIHRLLRAPREIISSSWSR